jgi:hypothetical protein
MRALRASYYLKDKRWIYRRKHTGNQKPLGKKKQKTTANSTPSDLPLQSLDLGAHHPLLSTPKRARNGNNSTLKPASDVSATSPLNSLFGRPFLRKDLPITAVVRERLEQLAHVHGGRLADPGHHGVHLHKRPRTANICRLSDQLITRRNTMNWPRTFLAR